MAQVCQQFSLSEVKVVAQTRGGFFAFYCTQALYQFHVALHILAVEIRRLYDPAYPVDFTHLLHSGRSNKNTSIGNAANN